MEDVYFYRDLNTAHFRLDLTTEHFMSKWFEADNVLSYVCKRTFKHWPVLIFQEGMGRIFFFLVKNSQGLCSLSKATCLHCTLRPPCRFPSQAWIFKFCTYNCKIARISPVCDQLQHIFTKQTNNKKKAKHKQMAVNCCKFIKWAFSPSGFFWLFLSPPTQAFLSQLWNKISLLICFNKRFWWSHCSECKNGEREHFIPFSAPFFGYFRYMFWFVGFGFFWFFFGLDLFSLLNCQCCDCL